MHAELVLLVDNHQPQRRKINIPLQEHHRPDDDIHLTIQNPPCQLLPLLAGNAAGNQLAPHTAALSKIAPCCHNAAAPKSPSAP